MAHPETASLADLHPVAPPLRTVVNVLENMIPHYGCLQVAEMFGFGAATFAASMALGYAGDEETLAHLRESDLTVEDLDTAVLAFSAIARHLHHAAKGNA